MLRTPVHPLGRLALEIVVFGIGFALITVAAIGPYGGALPGLRLAIALTVALGLLAWYRVTVRLIERQWPAELMLRRIGRLLVGVVAGALLVTVVVGVVTVLGGYRIDAVHSPGLLMARVGPSFHAAVWEELVFRGLLVRCLVDWKGPRLATAASAAIFGGMHGLLDGGSAWSALAVGLEAGVLLSVVFLAGRDLWLPIGMHAGWNLSLGGLFGSAVSGGAVSSVIEPVLSGPAWLTGGAFGLEASVPAVLVCVAAAWLTARWSAKVRVQADAR